MFDDLKQEETAHVDREKLNMFMNTLPVLRWACFEHPTWDEVGSVCFSAVDPQECFVHVGLNDGKGAGHVSYGVDFLSNVGVNFKTS